MRKVFYSVVKLKWDEPKDLSIFKSRDFELGDKEHFAPISYLLDANIEPNDDILIITDVMQTEEPLKNYEILKKDMDDILTAHNAKATFVIIESPDPAKRNEMDSLTFSRYFKELSDFLQDGDRLYADMTFGMKCNIICSFIAMTYAVKAGVDVNVERLVYAERYNGDRKLTLEKRPTSDIIDITSLFYISTLVNNAHPGQKKSMDSFLKFMIG